MMASNECSVVLTSGLAVLCCAVGCGASRFEASVSVHNILLSCLSFTTFMVEKFVLQLHRTVIDLNVTVSL